MDKPLQRLSRLGRYTIDPHDGSIDGPYGRQQVHPDAMQVLMCLMQQPGKVVDRDEILRTVWANPDVDGGMLDTHVSELRLALGDNSDTPQYIRAVPEKGYQLVAEVGEPGSAGATDSATLWSELKRRKVVRTALAYIAASWVVLQVVDTVTPPLPEQLRSVVLTVAIVGLPFALVLAWAYDVTLVRDKRGDVIHRMSEFVVGNVNRILLTGSALAAVLAVTVVVQTRHVMSFSASGRVVLSFENHTDDNALGLALADAFRIALEQSRHANVISRQRINEVLARMKVDSYGVIDRDTAQEVAIREGAQAVVVGSISRIGDAYSILAEVIDPVDSSIVYSTSGRAGGAALLEVVEDIADDVRENLGESLTSIAETSQPLDQVVTPNLDALRAFSLGREKKWRLEIQEAIDLMREAIKLDPEFAFAHIELGALLFGTSTDKRAYEQWEQALSFEDRLTQRDKLLVEALLAMRGSPEEVLRRFALLTNLYPNYATGYRMTGRVYWRLKNDFASAATNYARAADSDDIWLSDFQLGYCYLGLGEFNKSIAAFKKAYEQSGHYYTYGLADAYVASDKHSLARELLAPLIAGQAMPRNRDDAHTRLIGYYIDRGEFAQAQRTLAGLQRLPDRADPLDSLADNMTRLALYRYAADRSAYLQLLDAMTEKLEAAWDFAGQDGVPAPVAEAAFLGKLAARAGRVEFARQLHDLLSRRDDVQPFPINRALFVMLDAELLVAGGQYNEAISLLGEVVTDAHLYQVHESLAHAFEISGQTDFAVIELERLTAHRGQAFAEHLPRYVGREHSIGDATVAHYRLGQAFERQGQTQAARRQYQTLMTRWKHADAGIEALTLAEQRLASLRGGAR